MRSALLTLAALPSYVSGLDCNADTLTIDSQQDADSIPECVSQGVPLNKNLIISPEASGSIAFKHLEFINGSIYAEDSPELTSLSLDRSDSKPPSGRIYDVVIRNLTAFESFSFPYVPMIMLDSVLFDSLPSLHTINISDRVVPRDFRLRRLPSLQNLLLAPCGFGVTGSIEVNDVDVGISSIDMLFKLGFAAENISVDGIPNVTDLSYSLWTTKDVSIRGNGNLTFNFNNTDCEDEISVLPWSNASSIVVTGLGALQRIDDREDRMLKLYVGTFTATNISFSHLPIDFTNLTNLYITDNPELQTLSYNTNFTRYMWKDIVVRGNPKLKLNSTVEKPLGLSYTPDQHTSTWVWPNVDISSIELDGPFDNAFFEPFIVNPNGSNRPKVLKRFIVRSSLGPDQFNCSGLNNLRKAGILMGEYSCQNQTVSSAVRLVQAPGLLYVWLSTVVVVILPMYYSLFK